MDCKNWQTIQAKTEGLDLNRLIKEEFLSNLEEQLEDKDINIVNVSFVIKEKDSSSEDAVVDIISLINKSLEDTLNNTVILDMNNPNHFEPIINTVEQFRCDENDE